MLCLTQQSFSFFSPHPLPSLHSLPPPSFLTNQPPPPQTAATGYGTFVQGGCKKPKPSMGARRERRREMTSIRGPTPREMEIKGLFMRL